MESQLTLVDPAALDINPFGVAPSTVLQFQKDDIHNTTISGTRKGSPVRYTVHSDKHAQLTRVSRTSNEGEPAVVGVVRRRTLLPDTVTLGSSSEDIRLTRFITKPSFADLWVSLNLFTDKCLILTVCHDIADLRP